MWFLIYNESKRDHSILEQQKNILAIKELEKNLSAEEISKKLQPLDIIVWSGHVIIVLDNKTTIESTPAEGVHKSDLLARLTSVMEERTPVNDWASTSGKRFVVRRWMQ